MTGFYVVSGRAVWVSVLWLWHQCSESVTRWITSNLFHTHCMKLNKWNQGGIFFLPYFNLDYANTTSSQRTYCRKGRLILKTPLNLNCIFFPYSILIWYFSWLSNASFLWDKNQYPKCIHVYLMSFPVCVIPRATNRYFYKLINLPVVQ